MENHRSPAKPRKVAVASIAVGIAALNERELLERAKFREVPAHLRRQRLHIRPGRGGEIVLAQFISAAVMCSLAAWSRKTVSVVTGGRAVCIDDAITGSLHHVALAQRDYRKPGNSLPRQLRGPGKESLPEAFVPQAQFYQRGMYTVIKAANATSLAPLVRARIAEVDPTVPMYFFQTMDQRFAGELALPRFITGLVGAFSALALVLAGVGIFGVTAYSVAQRSREFGIRFALGAQRLHVAGLVLGRSGRLAVIGSTIGAVAAFQIEGLRTSLLVGVDSLNAPTLVVAAAIIVVTALIASLVPLTRALCVSPVDALRAE